jgi:lipoprotein LprG
MFHARRVSAVVLAAVLSIGAVACSDSGGEPAAETPEDVLAAAQQNLTETSGFHLILSTDDLPEGVQGLTAADGVASNAPAFEGDLTIFFAGTEVPVPVVAVDGTVYAQIPLTIGWSDVDPAEYGAPDPAALVSADSGFATLLTATTDVTEGESVRGGEDNDEVLTEYSGTVPGEAMKVVIPSARGASFDATYTITDSDELRTATLTGVFYPDTDPMTYTVRFEDYGSTQEITAP